MANVHYQQSWVDGSGNRPVKGTIRTGFRDQVVHGMTLAGLRSTATMGTVYVTVEGVPYKYDATDTTTPDDGDECIISSDNQRFKKLLNLAGGVDTSGGPQNVTNMLYNSFFTAWTRGTSFVAAGRVADCWQASAVNSVALNTDTPPEVGGNSIQFGHSVAAFSAVYQRLHSSECVGMGSKLLRVSGWIKSTVVSAATAGIGVYVPGAADDYTSYATFLDLPITLGAVGAWQFFSEVFTLPSTATRGFEVRIYRGNAAASTTRVAGVTCHIESVGIPRFGCLPARELVRCQEQFVRFAPASLAVVGFGYMSATDNGVVVIPLPSSMKTNLAVSAVMSDLRTYSGNVVKIPDAVAVRALSPGSVTLNVTVPTSVSPYTTNADVSLAVIGAGKLELLAEL